MLKRLPFFNQDALALKHQKSSEIITIDYSKRFQRIKGNVMSTEDRQKYLTLLRNNFIKEQRESLVFYVYYHDENYYGILSSCTQLNVNFLAKSNSILIEASEFEQLMMEVEEGGSAPVEESNHVWQAPEVAQPSWLDKPMSKTEETPMIKEEIIAQEISPSVDAPVYETDTTLVAEEIIQEIYVRTDDEAVASVESAQESEVEDDPYALTPEEIAAINAATHPAIEPLYKSEPSFVAPMEQQIPEIIEHVHGGIEETFVEPVFAQPSFQEPAPVFVSVDMEAKPVHYAETLHETQRKTIEVRQNSIELREEALRQREKAVNDWERSLNARESQVELLRDTFNARKQAIAQKEQRLVSIEEEVLFKRNVLEDSFAKLDEVKREARRVLG